MDKKKMPLSLIVLRFTNFMSLFQSPNLAILFGTAKSNFILISSLIIHLNERGLFRVVNVFCVIIPHL